jgi:V/A-type H+-transporting ATPase subunit C
MGIYGSQVYLNTRVTLFASRLLSEEQIERLPRLGLDDLAKHYSLAILQQEQGLPVGPQLRAVESALIQVVLNDLLVLIRPMYGEARELVTHWARKFELFNLKALIRGKLNGLGEAEIQANLHSLPPYLALPHQALLRTESVLELLRQLERGQYRAIAGQARKVYEEHRESFLLEAAIDQRYYAGLVKRARHLLGVDRDETRKVVGLHLDRVNLLWLLRYRFTYHLSPSEAYYQLVPSPLQLFRERLLVLVNLPNRERVLEALPEPLAQEMEGAESIAEVERRIYAITSRKLRTIIAYSPSAVARALAYLVLRELDLKRLFAVVQGRLLQLDDGVLRLALGLQTPDAAQTTTARVATI